MLFMIKRWLLRYCGYGRIKIIRVTVIKNIGRELRRHFFTVLCLFAIIWKRMDSSITSKKAIQKNTMAMYTRYCEALWGDLSDVPNEVLAALLCQTRLIPNLLTLGLLTML